MAKLVPIRAATGAGTWVQFSGYEAGNHLLQLNANTAMYIATDAAGVTKAFIPANTVVNLGHINAAGLWFQAVANTVNNVEGFQIVT